MLMYFKTESEEGSEAVSQKRLGRRITKSVLAVLISLIIFGMGINVGNGRLTFGSEDKQTGLPMQLDYTSVNKVYDTLKENYNGKLTANQLTDGLKHGLAEATNDPYTEYFTPAEAKKFNQQLNNSFSGIGAELGQDSDKNIIIVSPIKGFPAEKAGLKAQDIIATINNQSTSGLSIDEAVSKIRGPKGSKVTLGVIRDKSQALNFTITRENIQVPSVTTKTLDGNIGYMQISTFSDDTSQQAQKAADSFKQSGVKGIILDLRGNPGGLLDAAVDVSSLWVPDGKLIVAEKGTIGNVTHDANGSNKLGDLPTVVLIDGGSASAAEITAGALHDNKEAYVIGQKSYGKGVVQQLINFRDGGQLKVTVASWYRPNGQNINHKGITPDKTVVEPKDATPENDPQLQAAEAYLTNH